LDREDIIPFTSTAGHERTRSGFELSSGKAMLLRLNRQNSAGNGKNTEQKPVKRFFAELIMFDIR